jgi:hypothetical protein
MKYDVWFIPTRAAAKTFGWVRRKVTSVPLDKDSAEEVRHLKSVDAPIPDQEKYSCYKLQPVALTDDDARAMYEQPVEAYISSERFEELESLIRSGYPTSALLLAIRETAYAIQERIIIPPTSRD